MPTVTIDFPHTTDGMQQAQQVAQQYGGKLNMDAGSGPLAPSGPSSTPGSGSLSGLNQSIPPMGPPPGGPGGPGGAPDMDAGADMASMGPPPGGPGGGMPDMPPGMDASSPPPGPGSHLRMPVLHQHLGGQIPHIH